MYKLPDIVKKYINQHNVNPSCKIQNDRGHEPKFPTDKIIDDEDFNKIVDELSKEIFIFGLGNLRQYNFIEFKGFCKEKFLKDFKKLIKYKLDGFRISSRTKKGQNCMDYHTRHLIDKVKSCKGVSAEGVFTIENIIIALKSNRSQHSSTYVSEILRVLPGVGSGKGFSVTAYKPTMTKAICDYFKARNVLDICIGWGGRPIGAVASGSNYTGIEPASETFKALQNICNDLEINDKVKLINSTAEIILPKLNKEYDLAITSPPYFNLEMYNDEPTQSYNKGLTYGDWKEQYLKPWVYGVLNVLVIGGVSCWSVQNINSDGNYNLYDDVVELHKNKGWHLQKEVFCIGDKGKLPTEETFIFKKEDETIVNNEKIPINNETNTDIKLELPNKCLYCNKIIQKLLYNKYGYCSRKCKNNKIN